MWLKVFKTSVLVPTQEYSTVLYANSTDRSYHETPDLLTLLPTTHNNQTKSYMDLYLLHTLHTYTVLLYSLATTVLGVTNIMQQVLLYTGFS